MRDGWWKMMVRLTDGDSDGQLESVREQWTGRERQTGGQDGVMGRVIQAHTDHEGRRVT